MMHFRRFATKKALNDAIKSGVLANKDAAHYFEETSLFGQEYRSNGIFCVCMDHPKRSKFANITVTNDRITAVK